LLVIGVYALKHAGLDGDGVGEALKVLFWLAVVDLPLIYVVLQVIAGKAPAGQVAFITTLTSVFLAGVSALYVAVLARRAYAVPALMLFSLAWELIVDFRFATRRAITSGYPWWSTSGTPSSRSEGAGS
ncbi:MAG: hypothetical protein GX625_14715, partial [Clostridiaceae bacterium]|nr:hypothetical protein [Clostridiaceae bacterium]